jgi:adenylate cyclase
MYAVTLAYPGRGEEAVRNAKLAIRLSPFDPRMFLFHCIAGFAHFAAGLYDDAAKYARASNAASPRFTANVRILIASLAAVGDDKGARAAGARLLELEPEFNLSSYEQTLLPYREPKVRAYFLSCLRSAGL